MNVLKHRTISAVCVAIAISTLNAYAGPKFEFDETKWLSLGVGARASFASIEDFAPNGDRSADFNLDGARIYINGQIHEYIKIEFNTECVFCGNSALREYNVLDAIAKFEFSSAFNIWAGRLLVPSDRAEMSGPFYANTYDFNKTPFYSSDYSVSFGSGGAGVYGRDHGVNVWGNLGAEGKFQYALGVFNGIESSAGFGPNQDDNLLYAGRFAYNFLSLEKNPGYYTSSTYFGGGGDIFTVALAFQYQEDGAGSFLNPGDFFGLSVDVLFEKVLGNDGVVTIEGEYKNFDADYALAAFGNADCFCMFDGDAFTVTGLYLLPQKMGFGKLQPYIRYTENSPDNSADRAEFEVGVNYIIDGHNARISLFYQTGDIATKGLNYAPGAAGSEVNAIKLAIQLQL